MLGQWRRFGVLLLAVAGMLSIAVPTAVGQLPPPPPHVLLQPVPVVRFGDATQQANYDRLCGTELAPMASFSRSAFVAEQVLDQIGVRHPSRSQLRSAHVAVRKAMVDHRDSRDALFRCLTFLEAAASNSSVDQAVVARTGIQLHQGSMTTIDGTIIQILTRMDRLEFGDTP